MAQTTTKPSNLPSACNVIGPVAPCSSQYKNWNFDPQNTLANTLVNPEVRSHFREAMKEAIDNGMHVKIAWSYRSHLNLLHYMFLESMLRLMHAKVLIIMDWG